MKTSTLVFGVACFTIGIAVGTGYSLGAVFAVFCIMLGGVFLLLSHMGVDVSRAGYFVTLGVIALGAGLLRADIARLDLSAHVLDNSIGETVSLEGVIVDEPDEREDVVHLIVETRADALHARSTKISVTVPLYPTWQYGDRVSLRGVLEEPENFLSDDNRHEFNYVQYLAKDNVFYEMYRPKIEHIASGEGNPLKAALFSVKHAFLENVSRVISEPYAALGGGLTVGAKQSLGAKLLADFRTVGIIHIVVLSGYNVTIIAESFMRVLGFLPALARASIGGVGIVLFAIMTGAGATIVRASIMALLVVLGRALGREVDIFRLLAIAALCMVVQNPLIVLYDPSFQLSFLATLGLILVAPLFEKQCAKYLLYVPKKFGLRDTVVSTIATQIFVLPMLVFMMGQVSLVALIVNLLVLLVIPVTMLFVFLAGISGFLSGLLSVGFAFFAFLLLYYEVTIVEFFARLPFASVGVPQIPLWVVFIWYGGYAYFLWKAKRR